MARKNTVHEYAKGRGTIISAYHSSEGNKIYKRNGYYYIFHIEFLNDGRGCGTYVYRSKNIYGTRADGSPGISGDAGNYELYKIGDDDCKGGSLPGQGSLINTPDGRWFWLGQFNRGSTGGRTPMLLPVTWVKDWPVIGTDIQGIHAKMKWQLSKPILKHPVILPQGDDEFNKSVLDAQWQWNHQPRADKWSPTQRKGYLRLHAFSQLEKGKFFKMANIICQRYLQSDTVIVTVSIDISKNDRWTGSRSITFAWR